VRVSPVASPGVLRASSIFVTSPNLEPFMRL
jgi:hypothetical protein